MSKDNIKTKGDVKALSAYEKMKAEQKQREFEIKQNKLIKKMNDVKRGQFKNIVINSFIETFANNYGTGLDYNSLIHSIKFTETEGQNGLDFSFSFDENGVEFKSDAKRECRKFNENSYDEFISNEDMINDDIFNINDFKNHDEEFGFNAENYISQQDSKKLLDGQFIPASDNKDRYGEFNRINKTLGYAPTNVSAKEASTSIQNKLKKYNF